MAKQPVISPKRKRRLPLWLKIVVGLFVVAGIMVCGSLAVVAFDPGFAAQNIDNLRDVVGDEAVAQLEQVVLTVQDDVQQLEYQLGLVKPSSPWANATPISTVQPNNTAVAALASDTSSPMPPTLTNTITSTWTQSPVPTTLAQVSLAPTDAATVIPATITRTPSYTPPSTLVSAAPTNTRTRPSLPDNIPSPTKTLSYNSLLSTEDVAAPTGTNTPFSTSLPTTVATVVTSEPTQFPPTTTVASTFTSPPIIVTTVAVSLPAAISATNT